MAEQTLSFDEMVALGVAESQANRPELSFREGDVTLAQTHASAAMADATLAVAAKLFRSTFLDGARDSELTTLVADHTGIQRKPALSAQTPLMISRSSSGAGGTIPAGTQFATAATPDQAQVTFTLDAPVTFGAGVNGPLGPFTATCTTSGRSGNVKAGTVTKVVDQLFDTFTVTNSDIGAGGASQESDEDLRQRARTWWSTLRRGTFAALEHGALLVPGVAIARVTEDARGHVIVQVADQSGGSNWIMVSNVQAELENWRCAGIVLTVLGGLAKVVDLRILVTARPGFDVDAAEDYLRDAVTARMLKMRVGETLYLAEIIAAVAGVSPDDIQNVVVDLITIDGTDQFFVFDIYPGDGYVVRPGTITVQAA